MRLDYSDALRRFLRQGTPGYLLVKAGLLRLDRLDEGYQFAATDLLVSWFPAGLPDLDAVAGAFEQLVVSIAYDHPGFLSGSTMGIQAIDILRRQGIAESEVGKIRGLLADAAGVVAFELESAKRSVR